MRKLSIPQGLILSTGEITTIVLDEHHSALIDTADLPLVASYSWRYLAGKCTGYAIASKNREYILMHRLLLNPEDCDVIDHIDHNGLNNRRYNLRLATTKQNNENRRGANKNSNSGFLGINQYTWQVNGKAYTYWIVHVRWSFS